MNLVINHQHPKMLGSPILMIVIGINKRYSA